MMAVSCKAVDSKLTKLQNVSDGPNNLTLAPMTYRLGLRQAGQKVAGVACAARNEDFRA